MTTRVLATTFSWVLILAAPLTAALGVFVLPWYFPCGMPSVGESYMAGFNNRVACLCLAGSICLMTSGLLLRQPNGSGRSDGYVGGSSARRLFPAWFEAKRFYLAGAGLAIATIIFFAGCYAVIPDLNYGEARFFLRKTDLLLMGLRPYRDFEFCYGPILLYLPSWIRSLSLGGVSYEASYVAALCACHVAGFVALFLFLEYLPLDRRQKAVAFLLTGVACVNLSFGLQYAPFRYALPWASLVVMHAMSAPVRRGWVFPAASFTLTFLTLAVSPEMGVMVAVCGVILSVLAWRAGRRISAGAGVAATVLACVAITASCPDFWASIMSFLQGGGNFPVVPNVHNLLLVAGSLIIVPNLLVDAWRHRRAMGGALAGVLAVGTGLLLVPALGRCDPGHVLYNGLGLFMLGFVFAARWGGKVFWVYAICCALFVGMSHAASWESCRSYWVKSSGQFIRSSPVLLSLMRHPVIGKFRGGDADEPGQAAMRLAGWRARWASEGAGSRVWSKVSFGKVLPFGEDLVRLRQWGELGHPFRTEPDIDRYLKITEALIPDYYTGLDNVVVPGQVRRKIGDLSRCRRLIVPEWAWNASAARDRWMWGNPETDLAEFERQESLFLSKLFLYPVVFKVHFPPYRPWREIMDYIHARYVIIGGFRDYFIVERQ